MNFEFGENFEEEKKQSKFTLWQKSSQILLKSLELVFHAPWQTVLNLEPAWLADVCARAART